MHIALTFYFLNVTSMLDVVTAKKKKALTNISMLASALLSKASFLSSVLCEDEECHHLAFQIGMFGMELARPPASNKAIEVHVIQCSYHFIDLHST